MSSGNSPIQPSHNNGHAQRIDDAIAASITNEASALRAMADNEVASSEHCPSPSAEQLAFERTLRDRVGVVMGSESAPEGLRERLLAAMAAASAELPKPAPSPLKMTDAPTSSGKPSLMGGLFARFGALAAVLVLSAAAIFMGVQSLGGGGLEDQYDRQFASAMSFVERQHDSCSTFGPRYESKFTIRDVEEAKVYLREHLGHTAPAFEDALPTLARAGYDFAGISHCAVPGDGVSAHAIFRNDTTGGSFSLFIQDIPKQFDGLAKDRCHICKERVRLGKPVAIWRDGDTLYYLQTTSVDTLALAAPLLGATVDPASLPAS